MKSKARPELDPLISFIREERKALGLTQAELAFRTGVSLLAIRNIEQGLSQPRLDTLNKLLDLMGYRLKPVPQRVIGRVDLPENATHE
jgi:transcriptional regulator with XRE-family HTH domain